MARPRNTAITLRNPPEPVARAVREHAVRYGVSLNQAGAQLLSGTHGEYGASGTRTEDRFGEFFGAISAESAGELQRSLAESRRIDPEAWE